MGYCPRCHEDGFQYELDCGDTVCEDCATERELQEGVCRKCRTPTVQTPSPVKVLAQKEQ
jgi:hypothetical protein